MRIKTKFSRPRLVCAAITGLLTAAVCSLNIYGGDGPLSPGLLAIVTTLSLLTGSFAAEYTYRYVSLGEDISPWDVLLQMGVHIFFWCLAGGLAGGLIVFGK